MNISWAYTQEQINWEELYDFYNNIPLGSKTAEQLKVVFSNSMFKCFAFDGDILIGAGRALADGQNTSYLCDIGVNPSYQGHGIGRMIVKNLIEQSKGHEKIILYACPGKEGFYAKLGFKKMNTAMAIFAKECEAKSCGIIA